MKVYKKLQRGLKHGMHRKVVCMFSHEPRKKNRALKSILHLSGSMSSLLQLPFQPPSTGNSHVPSSEISSCSITLVGPTKPTDAAVLQVTGQHVLLGTDFLPFITACPRPTHFQNILVSISCILCQTELYLTLQEGMFRSHSDLLQMSEKKEQLISEKTRHTRDAKRKRTDVWGGQMPDLLSDYALIP